MAAPTPTVRGTPGGIPLHDGYQTLVTLAADTDISFWEKTVKPPGIDGGDAIDNTTMHNVAWRTMRPRALKTSTEITCTAAYDPAVYTQLLAIVNVETTITVKFPDGSTEAIYGYVRTVEPSENTEGTQPEMTVTIQPTNWDHVNKAESGPAIAEVAGT